MGKKNTFYKKEDEMIPPESQQSPQMHPMAMMSQMMASFQSMMTGSQPYQENTVEISREVSHNIIIPKTVDRGIVKQQGLDIHPLYSKLFMDHENNQLNGIPAGCTITV